MGSRILHELSQEVVILLETGLRGDDGRQIPIFFCHPLDPFGDQHDPTEGTFGILYMTSIVPDLNLRQNGIECGSGLLDATIQPRLSRPPLWVRVRYVFLVAGGDAEQQLVALASALQTLHDHQCVRLPAGGDAGGGSEDLRPDEPDGRFGGGNSTAGDVVCPLGLVGDGEGWRELGLQEHRLTLAFEVACPIPSAPMEPVDRIQERGLSIEESAP